MMKENQSVGDSFAGRRVLVTGGLGFIGSNVARRLVEYGAHVTLVDSMVPAYGGNAFNIHDIQDKVNVNIADVRDEHSMAFLVRNRDFIFNLAGQVSHIDSMEDPYTDLEINVRAQLSILEACRKNNRDVKIVYTSTRQLYGKSNYLPVDEKHPAQPVDANGVNKLCGELYHILYNNVYDVRAVSLRLTNTYGPGQLIKHSRQGFIGWFIRQIVEGSEIQIFGDGTQLRDFNFVDDVVDAMMLVAVAPDADGQIFNLGGEQSIDLRSLVELMIDINGGGSYRFVPFPAEQKGIDIGDFQADFSKIKSALGWSPRTSLRDGLRKTIEYYKKNLNWYLQ